MIQTHTILHMSEIIGVFPSIPDFHGEAWSMKHIPGDRLITQAKARKVTLQHCLQHVIQTFRLTCSIQFGDGRRAGDATWRRHYPRSRWRCHYPCGHDHKGVWTDGWNLSFATTVNKSPAIPSVSSCFAFSNVLDQKCLRRQAALPSATL